MSAGVQDLFIELIGVLDWLISAFFWGVEKCVAKSRGGLGPLV